MSNTPRGARHQACDYMPTDFTLALDHYTTRGTSQETRLPENLRAWTVDARG